MKPKIHPDYKEAKVICACGNTFATRSTKPVLKIELCNKCHPFYSGGTRRLVDSAGQVERFKRRYKRKTEKAEEEKKE
ncbi:MAG: 50S ribosomal protein L31 [Chloroflexi bacterium]|nr:50S ribosomal protein L31 [Chloroflexota bacterium]